MKVVAVVQARMQSTRLPGKVLAGLAGEPMLARVVRRVGRARGLHEVVVATTGGTSDDAIAGLCARYRWECFRGSESDVLDRYYQAARAYEAGAVVRVTADCPLVDPELVQRVVEEFVADPGLDYVSNILAPRTYPRGLDVEVVRFAALERLWREDASPAGREHVTAAIRLAPEAFATRAVVNDHDLSFHRWTVDTAEDLAFARKIYACFPDDTFSWRDVLSLLMRHREWTYLNQAAVQGDPL